MREQTVGSRLEGDDLISRRSIVTEILGLCII